MDIEFDHDLDMFVLECTREELIILNNALNNIPQAVDEQEYTTLIGGEPEEVASLLHIINEALVEEDFDEDDDDALDDDEDEL